MLGANVAPCRAHPGARPLRVSRGHCGRGLNESGARLPPLVCRLERSENLTQGRSCAPLRVRRPARRASPRSRLAVVLLTEDGAAGHEGVRAGVGRGADVVGLDAAVHFEADVAARRRRSACAASRSCAARPGMKLWPPKPGVDAHHQHQVDLVDDPFENVDGCAAGLNTRPALQPSALISCSVRSTCVLASGWKLMRSAPALANCCAKRVDRRDHQVHVDGHGRAVGAHRVLLQRLADHRAEAEVGHVMVVHHVEVDPVGAGRDHVGELLAQAREVGGQDGRGDAVGGLHAGRRGNWRKARF